jgi:two-component system cell cycle sensor histidine kinase/response regulator CckA
MDPERTEDSGEPRLSTSSEYDTARSAEELNVERLMRAQRLASLGLVATNVAHDFRALLIPIAGYAHALGSQLPADPLLQQRAAEIVKAAELGREIVQQLLTFAYGQARAKRAVSVASIVSEALPLLRAAVDSHVDVRVAVDPLAPVVLADAVDLQRVLLNLVLNASRAIRPPRGVIEIGVAATHAPSSARGEAGTTPGVPELVRLTVADNGAGMSQAAVVRVVESLSLPITGARADGLGLWIVHQLVQAHGGRLWIESELDVGTTVRIDLPIAPDRARS